MSNPSELRALARYHQQRGASLAQMHQNSKPCDRDSKWLREAADHFTIAGGLNSMASHQIDLGPPMYDSNSSSRPQSEDRFGNPVESQYDR
jgi:hypothetical protein